MRGCAGSYILLRTGWRCVLAGVTFGLEVADHGLDSGAAAQFAFDDAEHGALLAGDEDAASILLIAFTHLPHGDFRIK